MKNVLAGVFAAALGAGLVASPARAECSPESLMAKVGTLTDLLTRQMQLPSGRRQAVAVRMRETMARHPATVHDCDGVCAAYDELIAQARG